MNKFLIIAVALLVVVAAVFIATKPAATPSEDMVIGGERDAHGCLGPAGYAFDAEVGACIRSFEMTPDIKNAARIAVEEAGEGYALTVVSFNSYEEVGAYDIMLERGAERTPETIYIRGGKVVPKPLE